MDNNSLKVLTIFALCLFTLSSVAECRNLKKYYKQIEAPKDIGAPPPEQYYDQRLDHFDESNTATWKQVNFISNQN